MKKFFLFFVVAMLLIPSAASAATLVRIVAPTVAYQNPGFGKVVKRIPVITPYGHDQMALRVFTQVEGVKTNGQSVTYYKVHLPYRRSRLDSSNGHVGWVSSDTTVAFTTPYHVVTNTRKHRLYLYQGKRVWRHWSIVNGRHSAPTPHGKFSVYGKTNRRHGFDGAAILPFAYSKVWAQFDGGHGMVAMHGRAGTSFATPLGTAGSNGCVRMNNNHISLLYRLLPIGTPVDVI